MGVPVTVQATLSLITGKTPSGKSEKENFGLEEKQKQIVVSLSQKHATLSLTGIPSQGYPPFANIANMDWMRISSFW